MTYTPIEKISILADERETVVNMDPVNNTCEIYSSDFRMIRKLRKFLSESNEAELVHEDQYGLEVRVPAKWVKINKPKQKVLTKEQRAALAQKMAEMRAKQQSILQAEEEAHGRG